MQDVPAKPLPPSAYASTPSLEALLETAKKRILGGLGGVPVASLSRQEKAFVNHVLDAFVVVHRERQLVRYPHARYYKPGTSKVRRDRQTFTVFTLTFGAMRPQESAVLMPKPQAEAWAADLYGKEVPAGAWGQHAAHAVPVPVDCRVRRFSAPVPLVRSRRAAPAPFWNSVEEHESRMPTLRTSGH